MRIWIKIFLLCTGVFALVVSVAGVILMENQYNRQTTAAIITALQKDEDVQADMTRTLSTIISSGTVQIQASMLRAASALLRERCERSQDATSFELYDQEYRLLAASRGRPAIGRRRPELSDSLATGKTVYILRYASNDRYLYTASVTGPYLIVLITDLAPLERLRGESYRLLAGLGSLGLFLLLILTPFLSRWITGPLERLRASAAEIAAGDFEERAVIATRDEVGDLAKSFNLMAGKIAAVINDLKKGNQQKQDFIDNLIHELRTPLTSIIGYADFLRQAAYDPALHAKGLAHIGSEGRRLLETAERLMGLILYRRESLDQQETDLRSLLEDVAAIMRPRLLEKDLRLLLDVLAGFFFRLDRAAMRIVLVNLMENSVRACVIGGSIRLGAFSLGERIVIFVHDDGRGIAEEDLARLGEPFYRVDKARSRQEGGAGLGLALCRQIVSAHGGDMRIRSEIGRGTMVEIILPVQLHDIVVR